ncbi:hypothetical protein Hanom_Chr04g00365061 [Helianthus anomalus]
MIINFFFFSNLHKNKIIHFHLLFSTSCNPPFKTSFRTNRHPPLATPTRPSRTGSNQRRA